MSSLVGFPESHSDLSTLYRNSMNIAKATDASMEIGEARKAVANDRPCLDGFP